MAVVTHHPVIVELEGVTLRQLTVDEDVALTVYLQVVALVNLDATLRYRQVGEELYLQARLLLDDG